jgi:hypothetical protein
LDLPIKHNGIVTQIIFVGPKDLKVWNWANLGHET